MLAITALEEEAKNLSLYTIGPIIQSGSSNPVEGSDSLRWLNNQPSGSALFVCFGSDGTLSFDQMNELALGLELSKQKFLWVRTKEEGLVVPSWAPQAQVLGHNSTGGFLSHCGWNSTLESIMQGIPKIAWPLFAEQRMNAILLTGVLKVALRPKANEKGLVDQEEIAKVRKGLMVGEEGKKVHNHMKNLKIAAEKALSPNGSSAKSLADLASHYSTKSWNGHLIPLVELPSYFFFTTTSTSHASFHNWSPSKAMKEALQALPTNIDHVFLPPVSLEELGGVKPGIQITLTMTRSLPPLRDVLTTLVATTLVDLFGTDALDVAKELKVSPYIFYPTNAMVVSLVLHLPKLDETVSCEYRDLPEPVKLPGACLFTVEIF
ncbi:hydroquinone glucosyltransferase [Quercus suber]|uniref:Hydroquinone glucosyltransferase n=1 Tax=Quercus suber TaxID=58331 RepID=A0AAW0JCX0_QUESU